MNRDGWTPVDYVSKLKTHIRREAFKRIRGMFSRVHFTGRVADEAFTDALYEGWARYAEGASDRNRPYLDKNGMPQTEEEDKAFFLWCCEKAAQNIADPIRRGRHPVPMSTLGHPGVRKHLAGASESHHSESWEDHLIETSVSINDLRSRRKTQRSLSEALFASEERYLAARRAALAIPEHHADTILRKLQGGQMDAPGRAELRAAVNAFLAAVKEGNPEPCGDAWVANLELLRVMDAVYLGRDLSTVGEKPAAPKRSRETIGNLARAAVQTPLFLLE